MILDQGASYGQVARLSGEHDRLRLDEIELTDAMPVIDCIDQRDNTSIPRQKAEIEKFLTSQGWDFVGFYVDESQSGAKVEGREDFQRMMRDAANGKFDIIIPYDISRFGRDGTDIITQTSFLKTNYDVHVRHWKPILNEPIND